MHVIKVEARPQAWHEAAAEHAAVNHAGWWAAYKCDVGRYVAYGGGGALKQILTQQGLWALLQFRVASAIHRSRLPHPLKRPILVFCVVWRKCMEVITGISLPYTARIGRGLYIGHYGNVILNEKAVLGCFCNISQGVTIGVSGRGEKRGVPVIGNRVFIGANAVVAGAVMVGDDSVIGANSLVITEVPPASTFVGVPAVRSSDRGSEDYLSPSAGL